MPAARQPALERTLAVPCAPFDLDLGHTALWPHGLAVLVPQAVPPALQALHAGLAAALRALALPVDARPFRPHVTLARHADGARLPPPPALRWRVRGYALVESVAPAVAGGGRGGRVYRPLVHYPATAGA